MESTKRLFIFDLDGTLLDTIADLAESTNYALSKNGFPTHDTQAYRFFIGNGINKLFTRALPEEYREDDNVVMNIRKDFLAYYDANNAKYSSPYPGILELLAALQERGIILAVASNKYQQATEKLVAHYFPTIKFAKVLGQRDGIPHKPDPHIVCEILEATGIDKEHTLYIGDSGVDMQTVTNSGVEGVGVTWGFRPRTELEAHNPAYIVDEAQEILKLIS
jgi:haloacid dehalogenase superfamily, subfamily IA, variant 1 with third motif having Dx(3-4)D or Dx(3-4)E